MARRLGLHVHTNLYRMAVLTRQCAGRGDRIERSRPVHNRRPILSATPRGGVSVSEPLTPSEFGRSAVDISVVALLIIVALTLVINIKAGHQKR